MIRQTFTRFDYKTYIFCSIYKKKIKTEFVYQKGRKVIVLVYSIIY